MGSVFVGERSPPAAISHDLPLVDAVRGGSSLLVALCHCGGLVWTTSRLFPFGGALGVDFFIMISGFLMTMILLRSGRPILTGENLGPFYIRRFFRIAPVFYVAYLMSVVIAPVSVTNFLLHVTFANGLFPEYATNSVIKPFWSITLEMQFYVVAPLILAVVSARKGWLLLPALGLVNIAAARLWGNYGAPGPLGSFELPAFLPLSIGMFTVGIILGLHYLRSRHAPPLVISLAIVLWTAFQHSFYLHSLLAALAGAVVLIGISSPSVREATQRAFAGPRLRGLFKLLADYSYSLYLFHSFAALVVARWWTNTGWFRSLPESVQYLVVVGFVLSVSYGVAAVTCRFVERPGVALGTRICRRYASRCEAGGR